MSKKLFESTEEFPPATETVKAAQVLSETPSNYMPLPLQRNFPQLSVDNKVRPRKGHGY